MVEVSVPRSIHWSTDLNDPKTTLIHLYGTNLALSKQASFHDLVGPSLTKQKGLA